MKSEKDRIRLKPWTCEINGGRVSLNISPSRRLLDILRDDLGMTGTKRSCDIGRCGACMVQMDGVPVNSCLVSAYQTEGRSITTIEGIGRDGLHPVQQAFLEEGGFQCGYCTPGMIMTVIALLDEHPDPEQEQVEEALSGNLCRCTGYAAILRSVRRASERIIRERLGPGGKVDARI
ncbi:(2Fe-2S)-binding protein [Paenibacillus favisporus]|uniref:(2Fe-2S)-binding protein n=1 Tax=Paenibacillus TaxID=44249 RepID=UPI0011AB4840|nr:MULTISPECIES: (2Fe-2S)-binding protein [Paenibacillus]MEC0177342.1 (2Fe-2S)-binding protein [Paenibacillus favisporus]